MVTCSLTFSVSICRCLFGCYFSNLYAKGFPKLGSRFRSESPHGPFEKAPKIQTFTFHPSTTCKCQKPFFNFYRKKTNVLHTCTFHFGKTYKCAVTVCTNEKYIKTLKYRALQSLILEQLFINLSPCWSNTFWAPLLFNVGRHWHLCGSILMLVHQHTSFRHPNLPKHLRTTADTLAEGTLHSNRPEAGPCRRHIDKERGGVFVPQTRVKRKLEFLSIFCRPGIDFGSHFGEWSMFWACFSCRFLCQCSGCQGGARVIELALHKTNILTQIILTEIVKVFGSAAVTLCAYNAI